MENKRLFAAFLLVIALFAPIMVPAQKISRTSETGVPSTPQYNIVAIPFAVEGDTAAQGLGISESGVATGRSIGTGAKAFTWTQAGGLTELTNLAGRNFCRADSANINGVAAGVCASSLSGTGRVPVIWQNGAVSQLDLPGSETVGDALSVNDSGIATGSVGSGIGQRGAFWSNGAVNVITQTTTGGSTFRTTTSINNSGRIGGNGIDPLNAARNVGMIFDIGSANAFEVGALPDRNGALVFAVSNAGHAVGSSMQNQGSGLPYIWTQATGIQAIPLPTGTTQGSARGVNDSGWAVGTASSQFAIPFLFDGTNTYRIADLIPAGTGWDLQTNTSSSAMAISNDGVIVGTGMFNGQIRAYAMIPVSNASLGGRIITNGGRPVRNAMVTVSGGGLPSPITTYTGSFGTYQFDGLATGSSYTVTVSAGKVLFAQPSQVVLLTGNVSNIDFVADPQ